MADLCFQSGNLVASTQGVEPQDRCSGKTLRPGLNVMVEEVESVPPSLRSV